MRSPFDLGAKQMKDISLRILDMECAACVARLDRALEKLPEGWHLRYEAANEADGSAIVSDVKLETATRRAVVINEADGGGYGLLLDPKTPTATRIDGGDGGSLTLNVVTQEVAWQLSRQGHGFITLAYTLLIGAQPLSVLRVELTLTKEEN